MTGGRYSCAGWVSTGKSAAGSVCQAREVRREELVCRPAESFDEGDAEGKELRRHYLLLDGVVASAVTLFVLLRFGM